MKASKNIFLTFLCAITIGCGGGNNTSDGFSIDPDDSAALVGSPLSLYVYSIPEGDGTDKPETLRGTCAVPNGTAAGSAGAYVACTVSIPEQTLYYSDIKFTFGTDDSSKCDMIAFRPYFFLRSTSAAYQQLSGSPLNCSGSPYTLDKKCYGGAGPAMITGFPATQGSYFLPANFLVGTATLQSANKRRTTDPDISYYTNTNTTNNLASAARNTALSFPTDEINYAGDSDYYEDYKIFCTDRWGNDDYTITLTIRDDDNQGSEVQDDFWDWFD